jgi:hypothetical protein
VKVFVWSLSLYNNIHLWEPVKIDEDLVPITQNKEELVVLKDLMETAKAP